MSAPEKHSVEIRKAVGDAVLALPRDGYDFSRVSPEITKAGYALDEAMADYQEGRATERFVKDRFQLWRDLHKTGGMLG